MVTTAAFNALLKLVEEPPDFLVFVFATTEPDKVLTTIRSRTHHYPFRLIPPGVLRAHLESICVEGGHRGRAGGAAAGRAGRAAAARATRCRSSTSCSPAPGPEGVTYARAVGLLGVTDAALIDDIVDALAAGDGAAVYGTIDRVVEAGHDPRRFSIDLLDRFRDLILLDAVPDAPARGLDRRAAGPGRADDRPGRAARRGDADPLRRDRAHRADRDARDDLAAAGARTAVRAHAAARCRGGLCGAAAAPRAPRTRARARRDPGRAAQPRSRRTPAAANAPAARPAASARRPRRPSRTRAEPSTAEAGDGQAVAATGCRAPSARP